MAKFLLQSHELRQIENIGLFNRTQKLFTQNSRVRPLHAWQTKFIGSAVRANLIGRRVWQLCTNMQNCVNKFNRVPE